MDHLSLSQLQDLLFSTLRRPLESESPDDPSPHPPWTMGQLAEELLTGGPHLDGFQRWEIYHRQYWYRLLDSLAEDFPLLRRSLGSQRFTAMSQAYLTAYPSSSFTLRNLGGFLGEFLQNHPAWAGRSLRRALDIVAMEWARVECFDARSDPPLTLADLTSQPDAPVALQPYVKRLESQWDLGRWDPESAANPKRLSRPASWVVYRHQHRLGLERLNSSSARLLESFGANRSLSQALDELSIGPKVSPEAVSKSFETFFYYGWLCRPTSP